MRRAAPYGVARLLLQKLDLFGSGKQEGNIRFLHAPFIQCLREARVDRQPGKHRQAVFRSNRVQTAFPVNFNFLSKTSSIR